MELIGFTREMIDVAITRCNENGYDGFMRFDETWCREPKRNGKLRISGVIRANHADAPGARRTPRGHRTRSYDWQGHYDFMEQLLLQNPHGRIRSGLYGKCDYIGLLGFYTECGKVKGRIVESPWQGNGYRTITFGELEGNARAVAA